MIGIQNKKGLIAVAFAFLTAIITILVAISFIVTSRIPFTRARLKRAKAIQIAEAGLYEAFNRFRVNASGWDVNNWAGDKTITIDGVDVKITVADATSATNPDPKFCVPGTTVPRKRVDASVNISSVPLR